MLIVDLMVVVPLVDLAVVFVVEAFAGLTDGFVVVVDVFVVFADAFAGGFVIVEEFTGIDDEFVGFAVDFVAGGALAVVAC